MISCRFSNSMGVSMPRRLCRRWRLCQISRYSKIALASSMRVFQRRRSRSSTCIRDQKDSIIELKLLYPSSGLQLRRVGVRGGVQLARRGWESSVDLAGEVALEAADDLALGQA